MIAGQMSIFDFIQDNNNIFPPMIQKLHNRILEYYPQATKRVSYDVWGHVPNLGKRYENSFYADSSSDINGFAEALRKEFEPYQLEVSVIMSIWNEDKISCFVSSMWTTKGHKEVE